MACDDMIWLVGFQDEIPSPAPSVDVWEDGKNYVSEDGALDVADRLTKLYPESLIVVGYATYQGYESETGASNWSDMNIEYRFRGDKKLSEDGTVLPSSDAKTSGTQAIGMYAIAFHLMAIPYAPFIYAVQMGSSLQDAIRIARTTSVAVSNVAAEVRVYSLSKPLVDGNIIGTRVALCKNGIVYDGFGVLMPMEGGNN